MSAGNIGEIIKQDEAYWDSCKNGLDEGPKVLIATNVTGFQHATLVESVLAAALAIRGSKVEIITCDSALTACLKAGWAAFDGPEELAAKGMKENICASCIGTGNAHFDALGLPRHKFSQYLQPVDYVEVKTITAALQRDQLMSLKSEDGDAVGMQGLAGALRYYACGELPSGPAADDVLRRFVEAALLTTRVFDRLLAKEKYDVAVFHHGIYVPQGPAGDVLRRHGVRVVNWNPSYRKSTFIFSEGDTYHYTLMEEPVSLWDAMPWKASHATDISSYLKSRVDATRDWIWFHENEAPTRDQDKIITEMGLDSSKPIVGMLSNVAWDAQLHYPANAFENIFDWVKQTFDYFAERPDMQLLLRIHPAEIRGTARSRQPLNDLIQDWYPELPPNIFVIPPESPISTYSAMDLCNSVIIYGTKMGVELTAVGKSVIVGGEAWIRGKGLTHDASNGRHYRELLSQLPENLPKMSKEQIKRAQMYAYHFFFRRMLPLPIFVPEEGKTYGLELGGLQELAAGTHAGLDVVCDGIMRAKPFIYEAERLGLGEEINEKSEPRWGIKAGLRLLNAWR